MRHLGAHIKEAEMKDMRVVRDCRLGNFTNVITVMSRSTYCDDVAILQ
jgi:hypothetical protein